MAQPILSLETDKALLRQLRREIRDAQRNVKTVGSEALRNALAIGKLDAEEIANNYWNGVESWISKNTYTSRVRKGQLEGKVYMSGRKIELHRFMSREEMAQQWYVGENYRPNRPPGVRIKVYKQAGPVTFPGTFIQQMRSGFFSVFKRVGATWSGNQRLPIKVQYAEQDMNYPLIQNITQFERKATDQFVFELNFELDKLSGAI